MTFMVHKQVVAVLGATGQVGYPLSKGLLSLGHHTKCLSRHPVEKNPKLQELQDLGAEIVVVDNMDDVNEMTEVLKGCDVLVCAVPASERVLEVSEPIWLEACLKASVGRIVPNEFGLHTRGADYGDGIIFDSKKKFQEKVFDSGIGWTLFYNGGIFDYFLPNLRFFDKITTFGDVDLPIPTHEIRDIGAVAAMAVTDERTLNKCVQMDYNVLTQRQMLELLKKSHPNREIEYEHFSSEFIKEARKNASNEITSKKGSETDAERWGINEAVFVKGKMATYTEDTLRTTELYPDYKVLEKPEDAIADPIFVFGS